MITRARGSLSLLAFAAAYALAPSANAQQAGYASNHYNPSERGSQWFALDSLNIAGNGRIALGAIGDYSYRSLVDYNSAGDARASIVRDQYLLHLGGSVTVADRIRIGVGVPIQAGADGRDGTINGVTHAHADDVAVGDVRISVDGRLLGEVNGPAVLGLGVSLFAPSGSPSAYTGDGKPRFEPHVMFAGRMSHIAYAARTGIMFRGRDEAFGDGYIGHEWNWGLSGGVLLFNDHLLVGPEIYGSTVLSNGQSFEGRTTPIEGLLGGHADLGHNLRAGLAGGLGLTRGFGAPVSRLLLSIEWVPGDAQQDVDLLDDRDNDGVPDCIDACSFVHGVANDDPKRNGCPADFDSDGISDDMDACPSTPGSRNPDSRLNGCPHDSDRDGIPDMADACPHKPGQQSTDPRISGCPDSDKDNDGIPDSSDACPDQSGPQSSDPKKNGCPTDPDRDHDGIPNDADACPDEAGKADPDPKKNGCPKAFLKDGTIKITDQVKFKTASAEILPGKESEDVLQAVVGVLKAHPEVKGIRVEGHTDNVGDAARNKTLSQQRAESVAKWLETHGIDKKRLNAVGFGAEKPIDSNDTDAGKTNNRRVEFHVEQGSGQ